MKKILKYDGIWLGIKKEVQVEKASVSRQTQEDEVYFHREIMEYLKSGLDIFLKRSIKTSVVNSHTVTYKPIAPADYPAQLEFNCSGHSDYFIDLNSVRLFLRIKLVKTDGSDIESAKPNTLVCVKNLLHSMFRSLSVSLNSKSFTLHETYYHYKAYLEKLPNYGSYESGTNLFSFLLPRFAWITQRQ